MIATWMLFSLATGTLFALAGVMLERALLRMRQPVRWLWLALLGMAVAMSVVPLARRVQVPARQAALSLTTPNSPARVTRSATAVMPSAVPQQFARPAWPIATLTRFQQRAARWDTALCTAWAIASALLALTLMLLARSPMRAGHAPIATADSREGGDDADRIPVLLTDNIGPAAVGVLRPRILLPRWALACDAEQRALMLRHEREHLTAHDPALLLVAALAIVLLPWHAALWWMTRRLRSAIEVDCDARVLRVEPDVRRYASLLLAVSARTSGNARPSPLFRAFVISMEGRPSHLAKRIHAMTTPRPARPARSSMVLAVCAVGIGSLAIAMPAPDLRGVGPFAAPLRSGTPPAASGDTHQAKGLVGTVLLRSDGRETDVLILTYGAARVALAGGTPTVHADTLRVRTPTSLIVDVTEGGLRFVSVNKQEFSIRAEFSDGVKMSSRGTAGQLTRSSMDSFAGEDSQVTTVIEVLSKSPSPAKVLVYLDNFDGRPSTAFDTVRMTTPFQLTRVLKKNGPSLHLQSQGREVISVSASLTGAPATHLAATGVHVVLAGDGSGIRDH